MRLGGLRASPGGEHDVSTVSEGLRAAAASLGQRPAITVLRPQRRDEQGFTSLLRWTAKGAHLLHDEWEVGPGDAVRVDAPPDWTTAAVCLAAWWVGAAVVTGAAGGETALTVAHESRALPSHEEPDLVIGEAVDGGPEGEASPYEPWTHAAQIHPDEPPPAHDEPEAEALRLDDGAVLTHRGLMDAAARWDAAGPLGVTRTSDPADWVPALVRPFATGAPTVVDAGSDPAATERERVETWAGR